MFERYTEKARRVIFFGRYEASQFGSRCIESEHLLLGMLREDKRIAERFLRGIYAVESIRTRIESLVRTRDKVSTSLDLPLSEECKRVLAYAAEEGERLGHKHIGTEHLFLGVLREERCLAAQILRERDLNLDQVREWVANPSFTPPARWDVQSEIPRGVDLERYSLKAVRAILLAQTEASQFASSAIEAEHLLLGLLIEDKVIASRLLRSGAALESIRKQIESNTQQAKRAPLKQAAELRRDIALIAQQMEKALANHDFQNAKLCAEQEREKRETLRQLGEKYVFDAFAVEEAAPPLSEQCQRVLNQGAEEATMLKQRYIGTEHLLLGILREEKSFAADILHESGLQLAQAREEIARWSQEQGGDHV